MDPEIHSCFGPAWGFRELLCFWPCQVSRGARADSEEGMGPGEGGGRGLRISTFWQPREGLLVGEHKEISPRVGDLGDTEEDIMYT